MTRYPFDKFVRFVALVCILAATAYGGVPPMDVTVFSPDGKVAYKGPIGSNATFATSTLHPGKYVVQFNARSAAVKGNQYLLVVSAGKKKVIADSVAGETLTRGGAAMKIQVGPGYQITGQVLPDVAVAKVDGAKYRVIDGKRYVWVSAGLGSNLPAHWEEVSTAPTRNIVVWNKDELQKRMDRGGEGSMITTESMEQYGLFTHGY